MAFITTQCPKSNEQDPHKIGPDDSCFDLPLDHIRDLLAQLGDRPKNETENDIDERLQFVTGFLENQEREHNERSPA